MKRTLAVLGAVAAAGASLIGLATPASATAATWTATINGVTGIRVVCNAYVPAAMTYNVSGITRTEGDYQGQPYVTFNPVPSMLSAQLKCVSGLGSSVVYDQGTWRNFSPGGLGFGSTLNNGSPWGAIVDNNAKPTDAANGYYEGWTEIKWGGFTTTWWPRALSGWNEGNVGGSANVIGFNIPGGGTANMWVNWIIGDNVSATYLDLAMPALPPEATTAGQAPYQGPGYCDITKVVGDTSETVEKDPAQTYRYEVTYAARTAVAGAAPDIITFGASWQENTPDAQVDYEDVTSPTVTKQPSTIGTAEWAVGPPLVPGPLVIYVTFDEPKVYALNFTCISADGFMSSWVGGDLEPDPHVEDIYNDLQKQKLQECVPDGWGILNPTAFARVFGCSMNYLFVPNTDRLAGKLELIEDKIPFVVITEGVGAVTAIYDGMGDALGTKCFTAGFAKALPDDQEAGFGSLNITLPAPSSAGCSGSNLVADASNDAGDLWGWRTTIRTALLVAVSLGVCMKVVRAFAPKGNPNDVAPL